MDVQGSLEEVRESLVGTCVHARSVCVSLRFVCPDQVEMRAQDARIAGQVHAWRAEVDAMRLDFEARMLKELEEMENRASQVIGGMCEREAKQQTDRHSPLS